MSDDDDFVLVIPVTPAAYRELDKEIDRGGTFAGHVFVLDDEHVYLPFWNREDRWGQDPRTFWDAHLLEDIRTVARQMQERFALPGPITFSVMGLNYVVPNMRHILGAAYPRPVAGGEISLPVHLERYLPVESMPPLKIFWDVQGRIFSYKLVGRIEDFLLCVGLDEQKDQMGLFRAVQNGTHFAHFHEMVQRLAACLEVTARAATGEYDAKKAWGVFWPEDAVDGGLPLILSESVLT